MKQYPKKGQNEILRLGEVLNTLVSGGGGFNCKVRGAQVAQLVGQLPSARVTTPGLSPGSGSLYSRESSPSPSLM